MDTLQQKLDWEIQQRNISLHSLLGSNNIKMPKQKLIPDFKAIVHNKTKEVLSIQRQTYKPLSNKNFMDSAEILAKAANGSVVGYESFKQGRSVLAFIKSDNPFSRINGDTINDYIVFGNSHDGSSSVFMGTSTQILACENQFSELKREFNFKHVGKILFKLNDAIERYKAYYNQKESMYADFENMQKVNIDDSLITTLTNRLFDIQKDGESSTKKINIIEDFNQSVEIEMTRLGKNLWGFFNAVTHYSTHFRGKNSKSYKTNNSFGNVLGSNASFNKKAKTIIVNAMKHNSETFTKPAGNTLSLETPFGFGKYRGKTLLEVAQTDQGYIDWCLINLNHFSITPQILEQIRYYHPKFSLSDKAMNMINRYKTEIGY